MGSFRAQHYIIKSNDQDDFQLEGLACMGYLYAHGDTRTFQRLRANIQQGKPIVMLHNLAGCHRIQLASASDGPRVLHHLLRSCGPLMFLTANLSAANWSTSWRP